MLVSTMSVDITVNERGPSADPRKNSPIRGRHLHEPDHGTVCADSELAELLSFFQLLASWDSDAESHGNRNKS